MRIFNKYRFGQSDGRAFLIAVLPIILYMAICTAVLMICSSVSSFIFYKNNIVEISDETINALSMPATGIAAAISIPFFIWLCKRYKQRRDANKFAFIANAPLEDAIAVRDAAEADPKNVKLKEYIWCVLAGVFGALSLNTIIYIIDKGRHIEEYMESTGSLFDLPIIIQIIISIILVPFAEELVFRGAHYRALRERLEIIPALIISSVFFGVYHWNLLQGIYAFLMGIILALCVEKYACVQASVICHVFANAVIIAANSTGLLGYLTVKNTVLGLILGVIMLGITLFTVLKILKVDAFRTKNADA